VTQAALAAIVLGVVVSSKWGSDMSFDRLKSAVEIGSTLLVAVAACIVIVTRFRPVAAPQRAGQQQIDVQGKIIQAGKIRHSIGTSKVALVEFSDYECPYCAAFAHDTAPLVKKELVDGGVLRVVEFNYPLRQIHPMAEMAAEAAECAGRQGRYWEMRNALFSAPQSITDDAVVGMTGALGLDRQSFVQCRSGAAGTDVESDVAIARALGVRATPTFFVGAVTQDGSVRLFRHLTGKVTIDDIRTAASEVQASLVASSSHP
jgi:protein-disulfide isomerase